MIQKLLLRAIILLVFVLLGTMQAMAQCNGPLVVPVLGSGTGIDLSASETHVDALCVGTNGSATISATGGTPPYSGTGTFPQMPGTLEYTVTDANGCTATVSVTILVLDGTAPTIACPTTGLVVTPNPGACSFTITGNEYDPVVSDNCGVSSTMYTMISGDVMPSSGSSLAGAVLGVGNTVIEWTVTDLSGLTATCQFTISVNSCLIITGNLIWKGDANTGVAKGMVALTGDAVDTDGPTPAGLFPAGGAYSLIANIGSNFTISPTKHISIPPLYTSLLNGLDVADAVGIQQHLVGIAPILDEYRLVAADCNKSYSISTIDAAIIRQALLGNPIAISILNTTKSWRFIPTDYLFPFAGPFNLPVFPETRTLVGLSADISGQDFYGVKVGDVIENANPAIKPDPDAKPLVWRVRDRLLKTGEVVDLDFSVINFTDIAAYQFALAFDTAALQFEQIEITGTGIALDPDGNFGIYDVQGGNLRTLWYENEGVTLRGPAPMFRIRFTVLEGGMNLSNVLGLSTKNLTPIAYNSLLSKRELELMFTRYGHLGLRGTEEKEAQAGGIQLLQNRPNPFAQQTVIGFVLPAACAAQLRILESDGRELLRIDNTYPAGYSEETILLRDIGTTGILYYELTTPYGKLVRKMKAVGP